MSHEVAAADAALTALHEAQAEVARLAAENDRLLGEYDYWRVQAQDVLTSLHAVEADNAALWQALQNLYDDWPGPSTETLVDAKMGLAAEHPGSALLAELHAARAFIRAIRTVAVIGGWTDAQNTTLAAYDDAREARKP
jgi:hypothetical protein